MGRFLCLHDSELTRSSRTDIRRTPVVVASLMWKPFDARFQVTLASIRLHADVVREELQFATIGHLRSAFQQEAENASKQQRENIAALERLQHGQDRQAQGTPYTPSSCPQDIQLLMSRSRRVIPSVGRSMAERSRLQNRL